MKASVVCSALASATLLAIATYAINSGENATPVADEPVPEPRVATLDALQSIITIKSIHVRDTLRDAETTLQVLVAKRDNAHATVTHSHRRAVLAMPPMVEYPDDAAERDMYKQMARERIDAAMEQYRHGGYGK